MADQDTKQTTEDVSRRDFLKKSTAVGAIALTGAVGIGSYLKWAATPRMPASEGVIFPDPSLCIGCLTCEVICSRVHREQGLSDIPRIRIFNDETVELHPEIIEHYPDRGNFLQMPCLMCPEAPCLPVCPVGAVFTESGTSARVINEETCIACGKCAEACPFDTYDEERATNDDVLGQGSRITYDPEKDVYVKCDLCYWREEGPACVSQCPVNIRILDGTVQADNLCLDVPRSDAATFIELKEFQTI